MSKSSRMLGGSDDSQGSWMHGDAHPKRARRLKIASATTGAMIIGAAVVLAATTWTVGLTGGNGSDQSQSVSNVTISATTTGSFTNQLFPGANGDVSITITNPNGAPVTVTGVSLPGNTTYATGYSDQSLGPAPPGCTSALSLVSWNYAAGRSGTAHTSTTPLVVGANASLTVTLTNDASMATTSPAACGTTYFKMPALTVIPRLPAPPRRPPARPPTPGPASRSAGAP